MRGKSAVKATPSLAILKTKRASSRSRRDSVAADLRSVTGFLWKHGPIVRRTGVTAPDHHGPAQYIKRRSAAAKQNGCGAFIGDLVGALGELEELLLGVEGLLGFLDALGIPGGLGAL